MAEARKLNDRRFTLRISQLDHQRLVQEALRREVSPSWVARRAIREWLDRANGIPKESEDCYGRETPPRR